MIISSCPKIFQRVHLTIKSGNVAAVGVMSDGNKCKSILKYLVLLISFSCSVDVTPPAQQRQQNKLPFDEMGNVLLDVMQGTLVCLDGYHVIVDVSKTVKNYFGFDQVRDFFKRNNISKILFCLDWIDWYIDIITDRR